MLTFFTCPKSFVDGHTAVIQWNAIRSWTLLKPTPQIILCGNEPGIADICKEFSLVHVRELDCNENGVPFVSDIFRRARAVSKSRLMCYINTDIILGQDFIGAICSLAKWNRKWVMIGARIDIEMCHRIDFGSPAWQSRVREIAASRGRPMDLSTDYFVFPSEIYSDLPDFAVGRPAYDNWLLWRTRRLGAALIDASSDVLAVHQLHDAASPTHAKSAETANNRELAGQWPATFILADASHQLRQGMVKSNYIRHIRARLSGFGQVSRGYFRQIAWLRRVLGKSVLEKCR